MKAFIKMFSIVVLACLTISLVCPAAIAADRNQEKRAIEKALFQRVKDLKEKEIKEGKINKKHIYSVQPESNQWKEIKDVSTKRALCFVSKSEAEKMTTEALLDTVLEYPMLVDLFAYEDSKTAVLKICDYFPALKVLLEREAIDDFFATYILNNSKGVIEIKTLYIKCLLNYITSENRSVGLMMVDENDGYVKTPGGKLVGYIEELKWSNHKITYEEAKAEQIALMRVYPSMSVISGPNPAYNCHSYAWYSQSTANKYWISDPTNYMTDGSCRVCRYPKAGDKIYYKYGAGIEGLHSGIVVTPPSSYSSTKVISKWSYLGVYTHYENDCPYYHGGNSTIQYWEAIR